MQYVWLQVRCCENSHFSKYDLSLISHGPSGGGFAETPSLQLHAVFMGFGFNAHLHRSCLLRGFASHADRN